MRRLQALLVRTHVVLRVAMHHAVGQRRRRPLDQLRGEFHRDHDRPVTYADLAVRRAPDLQRTAEGVVGVAAGLVVAITHPVDAHLFAEAAIEALENSGKLWRMLSRFRGPPKWREYAPTR